MVTSSSRKPFRIISKTNLSNFQKLEDGYWFPGGELIGWREENKIEHVKREVSNHSGRKNSEMVVSLIGGGILVTFIAEDKLKLLEELKV